MKLLELNHVAIHVADLDKSKDFYLNVFGLKEMARPAFSFPGAWFHLGTQQELHLIAGRQTPVSSAARGTHYALLIDDMDEWEKRLQSMGQEYLPRRTRPDGAFQIYVTDPDGYNIELCTLPSESP